MAAHRYWRIYVDANNGNATRTYIAEIQMMDARGGNDITHPPVGVGSNVSSGGSGSDVANPQQAFDNGTSSGDEWIRSATGGCWISYDFGSAKDIIQVKLSASGSSLGFDATRYPKDFKIEYSDNGSTWTTAATYTGETGWTVGQTRKYLFGADAGIDDPRVTQAVVYAVAGNSAEEARVSQAVPLVTGAAETSNGTYDVYVKQAVAYALVRGLPRRTMRAWTFTQDDHDFYGINLGEAETIVFDKLTAQWCQWKSPSYAYWRVADCVAWEGYNLGCDPLSGKIWKIDPTGRLDYGTTPIESQVSGMLTERFRKHVPIYMAEVALSEGEPPTGVDAGDVGIQLRTWDGFSWTDHGTVPSTDLGDDITVRFYGLGLMKSPGTVFEITDTGYSRRIDGLNIETLDNGV